MKIPNRTVPIRPIISVNVEDNEPPAIFAQPASVDSVVDVVLVTGVTVVLPPMDGTRIVSTSAPTKGLIRPARRGTVVEVVELVLDVVEVVVEVEV